MIKYCKQIGILDNEIPRLVFNREEMNRLEEKHSDPGDRKAAGDRTYGRCLHSMRIIFVRETAMKGGRLGKWVPMRKKGWKRYISRPWDYRAQREVLVHELVHYRFPSLRHGKKFEERIKEILRGKTFEPTHIHLFADSSKYYTVDVDGSTEEEIKKYRDTVTKAQTTREKYNEKARLYWELHKKLKEMAEGFDFWTQTEIGDLLRTTNNRRIPIDKSIRRLQNKLNELLNQNQA